jgi:hypothetical protein
MKAVPILLFALGAAFASACENYDYCHCLDPYYNANDTATRAICSSLGGGLYTNTGLNCLECCWDTDMDNCHWRMFCQVGKSGGYDSYCTNDGS